MNTLKTFLFLVALSVGLGLTSCVDNDFDQPENTFSISDENVITIGEILDLLNTSPTVLLDESTIGAETMYIKATVNADDASGNFFKTVTFQDATGALSIIPDRNELNAEFPEGNIIYIKLNGLTLTYDANLPRLGYGVSEGRLQRIPDILVNDFLIAGGKGETLIPEVTTISALQSNPTPFFNKLIQLDNVEFSLSYVGAPYADADNPQGPQTINTIIMDCEDNEIILRNSGFSDFATEIIPFENGSLVAIASIFNDDLQLFIRDTDDVLFTADRCDGSGGQATNEITIQSIQDRFYDLGVDKAEEGFITGTVISDRNTGQVNGQNVFLQNGEDGILVRFTSNHSFNLGDQLKVTVSGQEVSEFRGLLQLNNIPLFNAQLTGSGELPTPTEITVDEILLNNNTYESTRVLIKGATLSGSSTFAGDITVDDGTETINIFTFNTTSFADDPVPSGTVDVTGIVSQYDDEVQLVINGLQDISGGTVDPGGDDGDVDADFEGYTDFDPIDEKGWLNIATKGTRVWYGRNFDDNGFAECEAFQDDNPETEAWLITPVIDTDEKSLFSFDNSQAFWQHAGLSIWISPEFTNLDDANWVEIDEAVLANDGNDFYEFVASGDIELTDYFGGKVRVGFKYEGTAASNTTKVRIDNVKLK
ncbi:MAG: DUF5689 domain-containing protein [Saprospiraceae bacterium]|nr:DUF5689 domain-containing protein [Saprospiraceae bacterium]